MMSLVLFSLTGTVEQFKKKKIFLALGYRIRNNICHNIMERRMFNDESKCYYRRRVIHNNHKAFQKY